MPAPDAHGARWSLDTPWPARGAIAVLRISGRLEAVNAVARALSLHDLAPGAMSLRAIAGIDRALACRFDDGTLLLFPHAGRAIIEQLIGAIESAGARRATAPAPRATYPEAQSEIEARALAAIAGAASPLAIDVLLAQHDRWSRRDELGEVDDVTSRVIARLIHPPLVAAIGPPNVGKSSLLNALAGRSVSIVADQPGTTRDHVGAMIDLGGLVVRWIDCPGFDPRETDALSRQAQLAAQHVVAAADLVLSCGDAASGFLRDAPPGALAIGLRADLGSTAAAALWLSATRGTGLEATVAAIRDRLVPPAALADPRPWRFWDVEAKPGD